MKTDELIKMLATGVSPVRSLMAEKLIGMALLAGSVISLILLWMIYGIRPDLGEVSTSVAFWMKLGVPLASVGIGLVLIFILAHPGKRPGIGYWALVIPVAVLWAWAIWTWAAADPGIRPELLWGKTWKVCILNITFLALPVGAAILFALRRLAPTRPVLTGAIAGWCAGGAGASVYALHCPEMAAPFLAVWYVLGMMVPSAIMAYLGHRCLRW
ncbi:hypothetical protein SAMN05192560_0029 [Methylobacillus rhizosphaerae]|uniref:Anti-sigma-F factor NrsF n=1 Tax=Methylobacillus rhizosphaerae TaxID=551994 RepID=A0A238XNI6_9PROT|nr:DUF1109 domain-containing protein [Methylobacillus rhizosphaerae]SNR59914.1 hypothetical protein SAMN05192560_0029 [Methylobacillus rhizosphaerae]